MSSIFFTSDSHFSHSNIIAYCKRPWLKDGDYDYEMDNDLAKERNCGRWKSNEIKFARTQENDETIIENWNSVVKNKDIVYFLGDFAFARNSEDVEKIIKRLNGTIYLILGNHDKKPVKAASGFAWKRDYACIYIGKQKIVLSHYAHRVWDCKHYGSYHLYGHSHGTLPDDEGSYSIDIGVDSHNFTPISYEQVREIMSKKKVDLRKGRE